MHWLMLIFILTTEVAQDAIGEIARTDPDPARLHVECLKALVDAGFQPRSSDTSTSPSA